MRKRRMFSLLLFFVMIFVFIPTGCSRLSKNTTSQKKTLCIALPTETTIAESAKDSRLNLISNESGQKITISTAGDCTLGTDETFGYTGSFLYEYKRQGEDMAYFLKNVRNIFADDDLTLVNLETPLTTAVKKANKTFRFKGLPSFVNILKSGSVEAVNVANNHSYDYLKQGYNDTISYLKSAKIGIFGLGNKFTTDVKGMSIGVLGYQGWNSSSAAKAVIKKDIQGMRNAGVRIIIVNFHWGIERENYPNAVQKELGRYTIDAGADLVVGEHPHVIQGIENYKGKYIVYSLGNFCFGGNKNPSDKDTFIFQQTFEFNDGKKTGSSINIIPCSISSVKSRNDYQPTPLQGADKNRILDRLDRYSKGLNFKTR